MNSQDKDRFPESHPAQGKITTQNPELLALLRENSKTSLEDIRSSQSKTSAKGVNSDNVSPRKGDDNFPMTADASDHNNINPINASDRDCDGSERRVSIAAKESSGNPVSSKEFRFPHSNFGRSADRQYADPTNNRAHASGDPIRNQATTESTDNHLIDSLEYPNFEDRSVKENQTEPSKREPEPDFSDNLVEHSDIQPETEAQGTGRETPDVHLVDSLEEQGEPPPPVDLSSQKQVPVVIGSGDEIARPSTGGAPVVESGDDRSASLAPVSPSQKPYSSRRLKGRDSSDRSLLPVEQSSRAAISDHITTEEEVAEPEYDFAHEDTAPIRDLLSNDFRNVDEHVDQADYSPPSETNPRANSPLTWSVPKEDDAPLISRAPQEPVASEHTAATPDMSRMTSSSPPPNRMYVDSPTFTQQEEDEYKFVSSRLDDYDEFKDNATYRELDKIALKDDRDVNFNAGTGRNLYDAPTESTNNPRYEDRNQKGHVNSNPSPQKQFILKQSSRSPSQNGQFAVRNGERKDERTSPVRLLDNLSLQTNTEEDEDLEMERTYQQSLQQRLAEQAKNDTDVLIPRLNLPQESVEFTRDSLDDDDDTYRDTERSAYDPYAVHDSDQWVNPPLNPYQSDNIAHQPAAYGQYHNGYNESGHPNNTFPPGNGQGGFAGQPRHAVQIHNPPGNYYDNQGFSGYGPAPPLQQPLQTYQPSVAPHEQYPAVHGGYYDDSPQQPMAYDHHQEQYYQQNPPEPLQRYPTEIEAEYFIELPANQGTNYESDSGEQSPGRSKVDYVEKNKQNAFRNRPGQSYSEMKTKKKELEQFRKENLEFKPQPKKGKKKISAMKLDNDSFPASSDEGFEQILSNPEDTWKNRSAFLAHQKQGNSGSGKKIAKLKKYPSDSGMYQTRPRAADDTQKPFASEEQVLQRSALSTGNLSSPGRALTLKPITQEVWTEDGQRISVDINLKLMSPPTVAPGPALQRQKPVGPVPQGMQSSHGRIHYSPPGRPQPRSPQQQMPMAGGPLYSQSQGGPWAVRQPGGRGQSNLQRPPQQQAMRGQAGGSLPMGYHRGEPEKFRKHQQNVEQQQQMQEQLLQQQLVKKQQLQQQLQQLQSQAQHIEQGGQGPHQQPYVDDYNMYSNTTDYPYQSPRYQMAADQEYYGQSPRLASNQRTTANVNPYSRIPPITSGDHQKGFSRPKEQPEGYMNQFLEKKNREQQKKDYKVYTIDDYRKMQKEVRLGGLGPDTDNETYKEKAAKKIRQENYAREVMMRNQQQVVIKAKPPQYPKPKENGDILPKFKVAKEYSKHVPKPKVRPKENQYNSYEVSAQMSPVQGSARAKPASLSPSPSQTKNIDIIDLEQLHVRHERDKQNVAMMRQNMEIM